MSAAAFQRYRRMVADLLLARELAGGALSQDEEAERADELDGYWQQMTGDERRTIEDEVAHHTVELPLAARAPEHLMGGDVPLPEHARTPPRR